MRIRSFFGALLCLVCLCAALLAQTGLGTITGLLTDPTGAVVANAPIQARNLDTGLSYKVDSTETGNFTVTQLPIGRYELQVEVAGFKKYSRQGITLAAAQVLRNDIALEVGSTTDVVTVTGEATLLKTESGELAHDVKVSILEDLPVLAIGGSGTTAPTGVRNPWGLAVLIPGTQFISDARMVVNGAPQNTASYRVEGMDAGHNGGLRTYTQMMQPSVDAIQEVSVQTSNYAAEFGTAGGGLFNTTMKSGGNQYHGSIYDYAVNEALNAHQPYTGARSAQRRHDYGGTLGGAIRIPKIYDGRNKSFFFWNFEQFREDLRVSDAPTIGFPTVPTPQYRAGDFSQAIIGSGRNGQGIPLQISGQNYVDPLGRTALAGTIFDPLTERNVNVNGTNVLVRDQFPNNTIPQSRFDPVALKIQALVPLPRGATANQLGQNYQYAWPSHRTTEIPSFKVDQVIGSKGHLSFYWNQTNLESQYSAPLGNMEGFPTPITQARGTFINTRTMRLNYDMTVTPTLLLHLGVGYQRDDFDDHSPTTDYDAVKELGLKGATLNRNFPFIQSSAGVNAAGATVVPSVSTGGLSALGPPSQNPNSQIKPAGNANLLWVRGNHSYKVGAEFRANGYPTYAFTNTAGNYTLGASATGQTSLQGLTLSQGSTGFGYASFLLGAVTNITLATPLAAHTGQHQLAFFLQDTWKVTRTLTLDYGVRYDYGTYAREEHGRIADFSATTLNPSAGGHAGGSIFEATCGCNFAKNYPWAIGPRLGLAWKLADKTVLRAGIGLVYDQTLYIAGGSSTNQQTGAVPAFDQSIFQLKDGIPSSVAPKWPIFDAGLFPLPGTVGASPTLMDANAGRPARQLQWSLGLQRELGRNIVVEASYVANRGAWWGTSTTAPLTSLNVISPDTLKKYGFNDLTNPAEAALLTTTIANLSPAQRATLTARGVNLQPYVGFPTSQPVRQALLPFPQFNNSISPTNAPLGDTWYDSVQVTATKRFSHGLSMTTNYSYSKALELLSSPDVFNQKLGKTYSANADIPHQFRLSAQYTVPRIQSGSKLLSNKAVQYALTGWGVGMYLQYQSGPLMARPASSGANPLSNFIGRGPGPAQLIPGVSPWSVDWTDNSGQHHTDPLDINCHCFDPAKTIVFNPKAWTNIPDGQWGAQQDLIRSYRNFRQPQESMNFSRNFRFHERINFNIRAEFQNIFNRTRLAVPTGGLTGFQSAPQTANGLYTAGFGAVVPQVGTSGQRSGVLVARITF